MEMALVSEDADVLDKIGDVEGRRVIRTVDGRVNFFSETPDLPVCWQYRLERIHSSRLGDLENR
jgi:hypothetical protein